MARRPDAQNPPIRPDDASIPTVAASVQAWKRTLNFAAASAESGPVALDSFTLPSNPPQPGRKLPRSFDVRLRKSTQAFDLAWIFPLL
jgi:hypothetical protein